MSAANAMSSIIILKLAAAGFTLVGGGILAICMNVWVTRKVAHRPDDIFPHMPFEHRPHFQIRNKGNNSICLENPNATASNGSLGISQCHNFFAPSQYFTFNENGELKQEKSCVQATPPQTEMAECDDENKDQNWVYNNESEIYVPKYDKCLSAAENKLVLAVCDPVDNNQKWDFDPVDKDDKMYGAKYGQDNINYGEEGDLYSIT